MHPRCRLFESVTVTTNRCLCGGGEVVRKKCKFHLLFSFFLEGPSFTLPVCPSPPPPREICARPPRNSVKIETNETEEDLVGRRGGGAEGGCRDTGELFQMEGRTKEKICPSLSHSLLSDSMRRKVNRNVVCHFKYAVRVTREHHKFTHFHCEGHKA